MKARLVLATMLLLVLATVNSMAQIENPCGGTGDPDDTSTCPLDGGVMFLVILALFFVSYKLLRQYRAEKSL